MHFLSYIDPGTGALLLQIVVAAVAAVGLFFRKIFLSPFYKVVGLLKKSGENSEKDTENPPSS